MTVTRDRADRCPGILRPWPAQDGMLVRLRLVGGYLPAAELHSLLEVAERFGDGRIRVTSRANLQLRAFPGQQGRLTDEALEAIAATGLLPHPTHELVRNIMCSPQSGLFGGRADLRPLASELDGLLCQDPALAHLPGKFLFVLDDGRGDLIGRECDLGLVALGPDLAQLRIGDGWGQLVELSRAGDALITLAREFLAARGAGADAPWHVEELPEPFRSTRAPDARLPEACRPLTYGEVPGGRHVPVPDEGLDRAAVHALTDGADAVIVTPWRGILLPNREARDD